MKKKFLAVLSCGLAATFLFGCSNNASQKAETTAAQTEAAMAGALDVQLAGNAYYSESFMRNQPSEMQFAL